MFSNEEKWSIQTCSCCILLGACFTHHLFRVGASLLFSQWEKIDVIFAFAIAHFEFGVNGPGQRKQISAGSGPADKNKILNTLGQDLGNPFESDS